MKIRTFWTIFLKILGIWLVLDCLTVIPQFFASFSFFGTHHAENLLAGIITIIILFLTIGVYIFVLWLFVFKSEWIINILQLDKGFQEEKLDFNIHIKTVLTIAIIVIGGLIFINALPILCKEIFNSFQKETVFLEDRNFGWIIYYFIKTLIGYLLMTNSKSVINFIDKRKYSEQPN